MIAYTPQTPDRAGQRTTGSGTPAGRDTTSGHGSSGAREIIARINPAAASWLNYRDVLAAIRNGMPPALPGAHATKCEHADQPDHSAECVFDVRMHGAVLVRTSGERVTA